MNLKVLKNSINTYYNFSKEAQPIILKDLTQEKSQEKIDKLLEYIGKDLKLLKRDDVKYVVMRFATQGQEKAIELLDPYDNDMKKVIIELVQKGNKKAIEKLDCFDYDMRSILIILASRKNKIAIEKLNDYYTNLAIEMQEESDLRNEDFSFIDFKKMKEEERKKAIKNNKYNI